MDKSVTRELMDFIDRSPSCFHAVDNLAAMLEKAGFSELDEGERYSLGRGSCRFVRRNGSALAAFRIPDAEPEGFSIVAAHTDSPSFKLKGRKELATAHHTSLNVEAYGGVLMAPWLDRPLSLAGRVCVMEDGAIRERLVAFGRDLCQIPNLAIHQNRNANHGIDFEVQKHLQPLLAMGRREGILDELLAAELGVPRGAVVDSELFLFNRMKGVFWGAEDEFFSAPRIDDLECAWCAARALAEAAPGPRIQLCALFDNEEVGSGTKQGALGDFLLETVQRIGASLGWDEETRWIKKARSFMVSADNAHALHPNNPETSDPVNSVLMNGGVVIKYAGNQKYTTDAASASRLKAVLSRGGVPFQEFYNNANLPGGSTLGNLSATRYSIPTVDIGAAQLAMHSPWETAGAGDPGILLKGMRLFLED